MQTATPKSASAELLDAYEWDSEADFVISALSVRVGGAETQRQPVRMPHRVCAALLLHSEARGSRPHLLFTRDASPRGVGFVTREPLPLSHGGIVTLSDPTGRVLSVACTVLRFREAAPGWFEGALCFNRAQPAFRDPQVEPDRP